MDRRFMRIRIPRLKHLLAACVLACDVALRLVPKEPPRERARVLLIRLDGIGDFVLWLDAARSLRRIYPREEYELTLLGQTLWADLARDTGLFDRVEPLDRRRFVRDAWYRWRRLVYLRRAGYAVVVQARYDCEPLVEGAIMRAMGAPERIGFAGGGQDYGYTRLVSAKDLAQPELERNAQMMRFLGLKDFRADAPILAVSEPLPTFLLEKDYYVLFPGASWAGRRWPRTHFQEIGRRLFQEYGWLGVMCGGPEDEAACADILENIGVPAVNWAGRASLTQLASIIAGAKILISNETGAVHIGAAVGTRSVCIVGGGHYGRFMPYQLEAPSRRLPQAVAAPMDCFGCDWKCVYTVDPGSPTPCIANVTADAVWVRVLETLRGMSASEAAV